MDYKKGTNENLRPWTVGNRLTPFQKLGYSYRQLSMDNFGLQIQKAKATKFTKKFK